MAIIGLLSIGAIAGGSYAIKQGRITRKVKNVDQIASLLQAYYNDKSEYPRIGIISDGTPSTAIISNSQSGGERIITLTIPIRSLPSKETLEDTSITDSKITTSDDSLMNHLSVYSDGFNFNNEPCKSNGCYAYTRSSENTSSYALCVQLDTTSPVKQSNAKGDEGEICYCTGGSSDYNITCAATTQMK